MNDLNGNSILGIICEEAIRIEKLILPDPTTGRVPSSWETQNTLYDKLKKLLICFELLLDIINTSKDIDFSSIILKINNDGNTVLLLASSLTTFDRGIYILLSSKCFTDMKTGMIWVAGYINFVNTTNETASYKACKHKNYKLLKYLIYLGAEARYGKPCTDEFDKITIMKKRKPVILEKESTFAKLIKTSRVVYEGNRGVNNLEFSLLDPEKIKEILHLFQNKRDRDNINSRSDDLFHRYLTLACEYGIPFVIEELVKMRPSIVNFQTPKSKNALSGGTALMFSCQYTFPDVDSFYMINTLLKAGANPNFQDSDGNTALIDAIEFNQTADVIEALLKAGADINLKNKKGETALVIATKFNRPDIAELLTKPIRRGGRRRSNKNKTCHK